MTTKCSDGVVWCEAMKNPNVIYVANNNDSYNMK